MEPLAASNQPLSLAGSNDEDGIHPSEDGIQLHSRLASAVDRLPKFMKAESVKNQLRKSPHGVSEEEMEVTLPQGSLPETGVVPREKVKNLIDQNGIKVERKVMGGASQEGSIAKAAREKYLASQAEYNQAIDDRWKNPSQSPDLTDILTRRGAAYDEMNATAGKPDELVQAEKEFNANRTGPKRDESLARLQALQLKHETSSPRYEQYSTPGGIPGSYQEHLLKVPLKPQPKMPFEDYVKQTTGKTVADLNPTQLALKQRLYDAPPGEKESLKARDDIYRSPHWPEDPNVIAHWRADDRVGPNGEKVLHVHEVQSDLHQTGREKGYKGVDIPVKWTTYPGSKDGTMMTPQRSQVIRPLPNGRYEMRDYQTGMSKSYPTKEEAVAAAEEGYRREANKHSVPNLPFKNNEWANLALKDIMDHAIKNGYDAVQYNNGKLAKDYTAGGGGDLGGLKDWYERQIPARMQKLFGLKSEQHEIETPADVEGEYGYPGELRAAKHTIPFFRLRHNGKLQGNLEKAKKEGMFLLSNQVYR